MAFLFKSGDELFDGGVDLVKRKDYAKARNSFEKSIDKSPSKAPICRIYIGIIDTILGPTNSGAFSNLASLLEQSSESQIEFGITTLDTKSYAAECRLMVERISLMGISGGAKDKEEKGRKLVMLAQKYQMQIGNNPLRFNELQNGDTTVTGIKMAMNLQALGYESLADAAVLTDPKKAAEYLQNASNYRRQAGEDGSADLELVKSYSKSAKCWFCGRVATGEGIHFVGMSSDITPLLRNLQEDIVHSAPEDYSSIYVCRACFSAVSRRADEIAVKYHREAMEEIRRVEANMQAQINTLNSNIMRIGMNR